MDLNASVKKGTPFFFFILILLSQVAEVVNLSAMNDMVITLENITTGVVNVMAALLVLSVYKKKEGDAWGFYLLKLLLAGSFAVMVQMYCVAHQHGMYLDLLPVDGKVESSALILTYTPVLITAMIAMFAVVESKLGYSVMNKNNQN